MKRLHYKDAIGQELAISAIAANEGDLTGALADMRDAGYETTVAILEVVARNKTVEVQETRARIAPQLEAQLTADLLDETGRLTTVIGMAIQRTEERLMRNDLADPARVARDLSQIRSQSVEKRLALEGRPTSIVETRNFDEVVRSLEALGAARQVTVESTAEDA